jgi:hypothetical protein
MCKLHLTKHCPGGQATRKLRGPERGSSGLKLAGPCTDLRAQPVMLRECLSARQPPILRPFQVSATGSQWSGTCLELQGRRSPEHLPRTVSLFLTSALVPFSTFHNHSAAGYRTNPFSIFDTILHPRPPIHSFTVFSSSLVEEFSHAITRLICLACCRLCLFCHFFPYCQSID